MESNSRDEDILYTLSLECEDILIDLPEVLEKAGSRTTTRELHTEFQQRFAVWTAHLGVFARKSQCLDTRLRNFPDLQDLTVRLLDTLRRCLYQWKSTAARPLEEQVEHVRTTLQGIDDTLSRLNNLSVTIHRSRTDKLDLKARKMIMGTDSGLFESLCTTAVHTLYPGASPALKDWLIQSMILRWGRIMHFDKRHEQRSTRRERHAGLETIPETSTTATPSVPEVTNLLTIMPITSHSKITSTPSAQSSLSGVDIQQIRRRNRAPDELSTRFAKTLSVQVQQGHYPEPPDKEGNGVYFTCRWCPQLIDRRTLIGNAWQYVISYLLYPPPFPRLGF